LNGFYGVQITSAFVSPWPFAPGPSRQVAQKPPLSGSPACKSAVQVWMKTKSEVSGIVDHFDDGEIM
jgi:hypothetical protein